MDVSIVEKLKGWKAVTGMITAIVLVITGVLSVDDRYAKQASIEQSMSSMQAAIIDELRVEIAINRGAMMRNMRREILDLEYITGEDARLGNQPQRHLIGKLEQLRIDLRDLQNAN